MQMSLDEAHLILNVKKEDPLEIIEKVGQYHLHATVSSKVGLMADC